MNIVRAFEVSDSEPVCRIMASCTRELRKVYAPRPGAASVVQSPSHPSRIVAVDCSGNVVGVAECIARVSVLHVQGIAVAPTHRRHGVATDLLAYGAVLARKAGLPALEIATIKETGNVEIFRRLGFRIIEERLSERFRSHDERPVTEVTLERHVARPLEFPNRGLPVTPRYDAADPIRATWTRQRDAHGGMIPSETKGATP